MLWMRLTSHSAWSLPCYVSRVRHRHGNWDCGIFARLNILVPPRCRCGKEVAYDSEGHEGAEHAPSCERGIAEAATGRGAWPGRHRTRSSVCLLVNVYIGGQVAAPSNMGETPRYIRPANVKWLFVLSHCLTFKSKSCAVCIVLFWTWKVEGSLHLPRGSWAYSAVYCFPYQSLMSGRMHTRRMHASMRDECTQVWETNARKYERRMHASMRDECTLASMRDHRVLNIMHSL